VGGRERQRGVAFQLAGLGIQTVIGFIPPVDPVARLGTIGREVIPVVADL
jgi:hypothetical protein